MAISNSPVNGFSCMIKGFDLIMQPKVRPYVVIPLLINIVLFSILFIALWFSIDSFNLWLDNILPSWLSWLQALVKPLFILLAFIISLFTFAWVGNLIGGYFNGQLSLAVERYLTGTEPESPFENQTWYSQIFIEIGQALRKLRYTLNWLIILIIISFIPVINIVSPILWFLYGAWLLAFEYLENPMANHGLNFIQSRQRIRKQRLISLGFGSTAMLCTLIPVLNFFTMPAGVAGATYMWLEHFDSQKSI